LSTLNMGASGVSLLFQTLGTVLAFTLIASAESLFSAAAVDRLHDGPRTEYDRNSWPKVPATP
jgi:MFS superfamily sulfate permease-like transporter